MKSYTVQVDAIVEGQTFLKDAVIPDGHKLTVFPDARAAAYVQAGILVENEAIDDAAVEAAKMTANPPVGSVTPPSNVVETGFNAKGDTTLVPKKPDAPVKKPAGITLPEDHQTVVTPNVTGVLDIKGYSKDKLLEIAKATPGADFKESDSKQQLADAINSAIATNAADAARGGAGAQQNNG